MDSFRCLISLGFLHSNIYSDLVLVSRYVRPLLTCMTLFMCSWHLSWFFVCLWLMFFYQWQICIVLRFCTHSAIVSLMSSSLSIVLNSTKPLSLSKRSCEYFKLKVLKRFWGSLNTGKSPASFCSIVVRGTPAKEYTFQLVSMVLKLTKWLWYVGKKNGISAFERTINPTPNVQFSFSQKNCLI